MLVHHAEVMKPSPIKGHMTGSAMQEVELCRLERNRMLSQKGKEKGFGEEKLGFGNLGGQRMVVYSGQTLWLLH